MDTFGIRRCKRAQTYYLEGVELAKVYTTQISIQKGLHYIL